jgi:hypothetical protein
MTDKAHKEDRDRKEHSDNETILMALDQISQTIDVMNSVVGRLRTYVEEQEHAHETEIKEAMRSDRILH